MRSPQTVGGANGATNIGVSSNRPAGYTGSGSYSLVVPVSIDVANTVVAEVGVIFCPSGQISLGGYKISGYYYLDGPAFTDFAFLAAYQWGSNEAETGRTMIALNAGNDTLPNKQWVQFEKTVTVSAVANHLNFTLSPNSVSWYGTMYLDEIKVTGL
jgi:hypothetical protein